MSKHDLSRREFLTKSGLVVAATAGGAAGLGFVTMQQQASEWPFPYKEIDPDKAAQIAYDGYMGGFN